MRVLVTGVGGQLGHDVMNELLVRNHEVIGTGRALEYNGTIENSYRQQMTYVSMDITDKEFVNKIISEFKPEAVIHCAAWTAVDMAEDADKTEWVRKVNAVGTENVAFACKEINCKMIYISTDYVFDGSGETPWKPDCRDYHPLNVYGQTKLEGELAVARNLEKYFVVRIEWVFGKNGNNFVKTMLNIGKKNSLIRVVDDQIGIPTYTVDLARLLVDMIETEKYGYYHVTNEGVYVSWYEFAKEIFDQAVQLGHLEYNAECLDVQNVTTAEYGISKVKRPFNSRMDRSKLTENGFQVLPNWKDALRRYLKEMQF